MRKRVVALWVSILVVSSLGTVVIVRGDASAQEGLRATGSSLSQFERAKVEWLLANRLACRGCHVINGVGGHVGPNLNDVGDRMTTAEIEAHVLNPQARNSDSAMPRVQMPAAWRRSLATYLSGARGAVRAGVAASVPHIMPTPVSSTDGGALYARFCTVCHGPGGQGDGPNAQFLAVKPARHADARLMSERTDDWLFDVIARGGYPMNRHVSMPPYGDLLDARSIRALVAHLRRLCACVGPAWSRDGQRQSSR